MEKRIWYFTLWMALAVVFTPGCVEDPEPGPGFNEPFYVRFDFFGQTQTFEEDDPELQFALLPGVGHAFTNIFRPNSETTLYVTLHIDFDPDQQDFEDLTGVNIPVEDDQGVPWVRFFLEGSASYSTGVDPIDYTDSSWIVDEVIKGPSVDHNDPMTGKEKKGRSYILRGTFNFDISRSYWSASEPVEFFPVSNGQFSIRVFAP